MSSVRFEVKWKSNGISITPNNVHTIFYYEVATGCLLYIKNLSFPPELPGMQRAYDSMGRYCQLTELDPTLTWDDVQAIFDKGYLPLLDCKFSQFYRSAQKAKECSQHFTPEALAELELENKVICGFLRIFASLMSTTVSNIFFC
jgi:hypothetical protein